MKLAVTRPQMRFLDADDHRRLFKFVLKITVDPEETLDAEDTIGGQDVVE